MYSGNLAFQLSALLHLSTIFQHHCEIRQQGKINIFQPRSMARPNSNVVCLSDSTGYGLLPDPKGFGAASLVDPETKCAISISCGGSLMKKGSAQKSTMELFLEFLSRGSGLGPADDTLVVVGCIPARDSVPNRNWPLLEEHRRGHNIRETSKTIMEICSDCYNKTGLHFNKLLAPSAMRRVITSASEELLEGQPDGCIAVVICAGWNTNTDTAMSLQQL